MGEDLLSGLVPIASFGDGFPQENRERDSRQVGRINGKHDLSLFLFLLPVFEMPPGWNDVRSVGIVVTRIRIRIAGRKTIFQRILSAF